MTPLANLVRLSAVVVLYKTAASDAVALASLQAAVGRMRCRELEVDILVFDNSPETLAPSAVPNGIRYHQAGYNAGLALAYNWALGVAQSNGSSWLLLLDQDTILPPDFFDSLWEQLSLRRSDATVAALVPQVRSGGTLISPKRVGFLGLRPLGKRRLGIHDEEIMSINSGSVLRCDFLASLGGFDEAFWLDYLDHQLFRQLYANEKKVAVFDAILEHRLSVQDYRHTVTLERYRNILTAESAFIAANKSPVQIQLHRIRLLARSMKLLVYGQLKMAGLTLGKSWTFQSGHHGPGSFQKHSLSGTTFTDRERSE